jgi:hypothetical protein
MEELIKVLLRAETDGSISFGNYTLNKKEKLKDFEHRGDLYKVKTHSEVTKLEKNGMFCYESVPGSTVGHFNATIQGVEFIVSGAEDVHITIQLEENMLYEVFVKEVSVGEMKTNISGKLICSVELNEGELVPVKIVRV